MIRLTLEQFRYSSLLFIYSLLTLCIGGCVTNPGLDKYIKDAGWRPKEVQILADCYVPTFYKEGKVEKSGIDLEYNYDLCIRVAQAMTKKLNESVPNAIVNPEKTVISVGGQLGGNYKIDRLTSGSSAKKIAGQHLLPHINNRSESYASYPMKVLPTQVRQLARSEKYDQQRVDIAYGKIDHMPDSFHQAVSLITPQITEPLQQGITLLVLLVEGQLISQSLDAETDAAATVSAVATGVLSAILSGGNYVASSWQNTESMLTVSASIVDESGSVTWNEFAGSLSSMNSVSDAQKLVENLSNSPLSAYLPNDDQLSEPRVKKNETSTRPPPQHKPEMHQGSSEKSPGNIESSILYRKEAVTVGCAWGDCTNGVGKQILENGYVYLGEFNSGMWHGYGLTLDSDGDVCEGSHAANRGHGARQCLYVDGTRFYGRYKHGVRSGEGFFIKPDGNLDRVGTYKRGRLVNPSSIDMEELKFEIEDIRYEVPEILIRQVPKPLLDYRF